MKDVATGMKSVMYQVKVHSGKFVATVDTSVRHNNAGHSYAGRPSKNDELEKLCRTPANKSDIAEQLCRTSGIKLDNADQLCRTSGIRSDFSTFRTTTNTGLSAEYAGLPA